MTQDVAAIDSTRADIGMVYSLPIEVGEFLGRCQRIKTYTGGAFKFTGALYHGIRIAMVEAGTGPVRAERATHALQDAHRPAWVVSIGFAGALQPGLKLGHIVVANEIAGQQDELLKIDVVMNSDAEKGLHVGRTLTVDHMVRTIAEKQALAGQSGAIAVDMESLSVAKVCQSTKTRCMAVRAISDDMSRDLPPEVLSLVGETGAVRIGAVVASLWRRPSSIKDLWRLRDHAITAASRLAVFLDGVVVQLHRASSAGNGGFQK